MLRSLLAVFVSLVLVGCSTTGSFKVPKDTQLELYGRPVEVPENGQVKTRPFFWSAAGGVPYRLLNKDGTVLKEGKARAKFRVVSIFWPPMAIIYWPIGLNGAVMNDLTQENAADEKTSN